MGRLVVHRSTLGWGNKDWDNRNKDSPFPQPYREEVRLVVVVVVVAVVVGRWQWCLGRQQHQWLGRPQHPRRGSASLGQFDHRLVGQVADIVIANQTL